MGLQILHSHIRIRITYFTISPAMQYVFIATKSGFRWYSSAFTECFIFVYRKCHIEWYNPIRREPICKRGTSDKTTQNCTLSSSVCLRDGVVIRYPSDSPHRPWMPSDNMPGVLTARPQFWVLAWSVRHMLKHRPDIGSDRSIPHLIAGESVHSGLDASPSESQATWLKPLFCLCISSEQEEYWLWSFVHRRASEKAKPPKGVISEKFWIYRLGRFCCNQSSEENNFSKPSAKVPAIKGFRRRE